MSLFPAARLDSARAACAAAGLDALLLSPGSDLRYLTGYPALSTERLTLLVLPADGPATLIVPRLHCCPSRVKCFALKRQTARRIPPLEISC